MNTPQEFLQLVQTMRTLPPATAALASIVRTRGSTYRRIGARMLVEASGQVHHGLSGGCPQADIVARAQDVIAQQTPRRLVYNRENGADLLFEQGCGGEIEILLEPIHSNFKLAAFDHAAELIRNRSTGLFATQLPKENARPVRHFSYAQGQCHGMSPNQSTVHRLQDKLDHQAVAAALVTLDDQQWLLERISPRHRLIVVGDNSGSRALCGIALQLGWEVVLISSAASAMTQQLAGVSHLICPTAQRPPHLTLDKLTSAVIMTHSLANDVAWARTLADAKLNYLGVIGSRKRAAQLSAQTGLRHPQLHSPAGLDIGSETPASIGLSICAEIHAVLHQRQGQALATRSEAIHSACDTH